MVALKKFRGRLINGGWLDYSCLCMVNEADVSTSFWGRKKKKKNFSHAICEPEEGLALAGALLPL